MSRVGAFLAGDHSRLPHGLELMDQSLRAYSRLKDMDDSPHQRLDPKKRPTNRSTHSSILGHSSWDAWKRVVSPVPSSRPRSQWMRSNLGITLRFVASGRDPWTIHYNLPLEQIIVGTFWNTYAWRIDRYQHSKTAQSCRL